MRAKGAYGKRGLVRPKEKHVPKIQASTYTTTVGYRLEHEIKEDGQQTNERTDSGDQKGKRVNKGRKNSN